MALHNTLIWTKQEVVDDKFLISIANSSPVGTGTWRDSIESIPHSASGLDFHPILNNIVKGGVNYILASGALTVDFDWTGDDNPPSESDIDAYVSFLQSEEAGLGMSIENVVRTPTTLMFDFVADNENTSGPDSIFSYVPKASKGGQKIRDENTYLACVMRLGDSANNWTFKEYTVAAGERTTLHKQGTECYLLICSPSFIIGTTEIMVRSTALYTGGTPLEDGSLKNLQSSSVNLLNNGTTAAKIGMLYK